MILSLPSRQRHASTLSLFLVVLLSWYTVFGKNCKPKDCIDLKCYRVSTADGGAMIYPESISFTKLEVTCKQTGDGGGWVVYLRRFDGSLSFNRTWNMYKSGFGEQGERKESWLGNENAFQLIKSFMYMGSFAKLRIEAYGVNGASCVTTLDEFHISDETDNYMFLFNEGHGSHTRVVQDWTHSLGSYFATSDRTTGHKECSKQFSGGWWYGNRCHDVYFTGNYLKDNSSSSDDCYVKHFPGPLKSMDMLIRQMRGPRVCNNPCNNNGTCEYIEATDTHRCVCPKTHCGAKCEKDNSCKNNGTCEYSSDKKKLSCVCVGRYTGTQCEAIAEPAPEPEGKGVVFAVASLLVVLVVVGGIATWMIVANKKQRAQEQERLAREEEERERLLLAEQENEEEGVFGFLWS